MPKTFIHLPLCDLLVSLGASKEDAQVASTFCLEEACIDGLSETLTSLQNQSDADNSIPDEDATVNAESELKTDQEKLDFLVAEVKELREVMAPMALMFQEGEKLNQWTNNIIGAIDLLESTTELLREVNIKFLSQSRETILTGKVAKKET